MTHATPVVIVTGGSRGLGLGIVRALRENHYSVATCSRNPSTELSAVVEEFSQAPGSLFWHPCSIGNEQSEQEFFAAVGEWQGGQGGQGGWGGQGGAPLYGLINNAAIAGEGILATFPSVDILSIVEVNLLGALRLTRLALRRMLGQRSPGRIINISSIVGARGYNGLSTYSATKAGLDGLTRALAREVGPRQITVNSVAPGYLRTDLSASLGDSQREQIIRRTPLGRLGEVGDIVPMLLFLLSNQGAFITGQVLTIDGGISC